MTLESPTADSAALSKLGEAISSGPNAEMIRGLLSTIRESLVRKPSVEEMDELLNRIMRVAISVQQIGLEKGFEMVMEVFPSTVQNELVEVRRFIERNREPYPRQVIWQNDGLLSEPFRVVLLPDGSFSAETEMQDACGKPCWQKSNTHNLALEEALIGLYLGKKEGVDYPWHEKGTIICHVPVEDVAFKGQVPSTYYRLVVPDRANGSLFVEVIGIDALGEGTWTDVRFLDSYTRGMIAEIVQTALLTKINKMFPTSKVS